MINEIITLKDGRIATCSNDCTIKVFDPKTTLILILLFLVPPENPDGHRYRIISIAGLDNGNLVSIDYDDKLKIWSITNNCYKCLHTINKVSEYQLVGLSDNRVASKNFNNEVIIRVLNEPYNDNPKKLVLV